VDESAAPVPPRGCELFGELDVASGVGRAELEDGGDGEVSGAGVWEP